jgi:predicted AAA+ superfamily ATPase
MGGHYFDLEDPETPLKPEIAKLVLKDLKGLIIIDEFQRQPELFPLLRVFSDRRPLPARFLILGSASPQLVKGISESLAGRVIYREMGGFLLHEVAQKKQDALWRRGGYPLSFLAEDEQLSYEWRSNLIQTFLERDIPQLGIRIPAAALRRFWVMLAHYHGQVWNSAELARSIGTKEDTARKYLDILTGAFLVRQLQPWFENVGKRLVKSPKVYIRDSGILHVLLGLKDRTQILSHPKLGFSWEGFVLEQIIGMTGTHREVFFYKTHGGAELDCLIIKDGKRYGFECKYADSPLSTKAMHVVSEDIGLKRLWVVYPGERTYSLSDKIEVIPLGKIRHIMEEHNLVEKAKRA